LKVYKYTFWEGNFLNVNFQKILVVTIIHTFLVHLTLRVMGVIIITWRLSSAVSIINNICKLLYINFLFSEITGLLGAEQKCFMCIFSRVATKLQSAYVLAKGGWAGRRMLAYLR
jgi:hypothetical protein